MEKMDVQSVDLGPVLAESVQHRFAASPVVLRLPILHKTASPSCLALPEMQGMFWVSFRVSSRLQVNEGYQDGGRYFPVAVPVAVPVAACRIEQFEGSCAS
jgi:hypothetical protein